MVLSAFIRSSFENISFLKVSIHYRTNISSKNSIYLCRILCQDTPMRNTFLCETDNISHKYKYF